MAKETLEILTESMFYVLMALLKQPKCGTEIAQFVLEKTKKRVEIGPGTLYTILSKFEQSEYIEEIAVEGRKRTYQITDIGEKAYVKEKADFIKCWMMRLRRKCHEKKISINACHDL